MNINADNNYNDNNYSDNFNNHDYENENDNDIDNDSVLEVDFDVNELLKAVDNDNNAHIAKFTKSEIKQMKDDIIDKLGLDEDKSEELLEKLRYYRYIDDLASIKYGSYIRWINLRNPERIRLTNGGIMCDMKFYNDGVHIVCKNNRGRIFQIKFDENIIFQKLSDQEQIILQVMDLLK